MPQDAIAADIWSGYRFVCVTTIVPLEQNDGCLPVSRVNNRKGILHSETAETDDGASIIMQISRRRLGGYVDANPSWGEIGIGVEDQPRRWLVLIMEHIFLELKQ